MGRKAALVAFGLWLAAGMVAGGLLLLRHAPYRVPEADDAHLRALTGELAPGKVGVAHIMYRSCPCSARTITHLLERGAIPGVDELVLIVDDEGASDPDDQQLVTAGFRVTSITPLILKERFAIHAAPVLVVARPDHSVAYIGGYNRHKQEPRYADVSIINDVAHATEAATLPRAGPQRAGPGHDDPLSRRAIRTRARGLTTLYAGALLFDEPHIEAALRGWVDYTSTADPDATTSVAIAKFPDLDRLPPLRGRRILALRFAYPGDVDRGAQLASPLRAIAPIYIDQLGELPPADVAKIHNDPPNPGPSWSRGALLSSVDQAFATTLLGHVGAGTDAPFIAAEVRHLGNATTRDLMEMNEPDPNTCWIDGSLPEHLKSLIRTGAYAVEGMPLEPPRKLLALLALMQAMGVAYHLPGHGVGGAFCGATFDGTITWQEPIIYLLSNTPTLEAAMSEAGTDGVSTTDPFQMIRCQVSDWVGLVGSSTTRRFVVLHSPSERRTEEELRAFVQTFPDPFKWLVPSSAYAFIDTSKQRVVVALTRTDPPSPLVQIRSNPEVVAPDGLIFHRLREPLDQRFWDFVVFVDNPTGTQIAAHEGRIDLEHAIDDSSLPPSLRPPGS